MNKVRQIWYNLFPNGFFLSYAPMTIALLFNLLMTVITVKENLSDWLLLVNCVGLTFALHSFYEVRKFKKDEAFIKSVLKEVRPELMKAYSDTINGTEEATEEDYAELFRKSHEIINAAIERRKSLGNESKIDKT